jgi:hypothetical protein
VTDAIPGWRLGSAHTTDGARRPAFDLIGDALRVYRSHWRTVLALSGLVEGTAFLLHLPFVAAQIDQLRVLLTGDPVPTTDLAGAFAVGAGSGLSSGLAFAAGLVLMMVLAPLVVGPRDEGSVRRILLLARRRWRLLVGVVAVVTLGFGLLSALAAAGTWPLSVAAARTPAEGARIVPLALPVLGAWALIGVALVYLALRWAVAPASVLGDGLGLRASLARSSSLTRRRLGYVFLVYAATSILVGVATGIPTIAALALLWLSGTPGPLQMALAAALYLVAIVVVSPISGLVAAVLYRDLRGGGVTADETRPL